MQDGHRLPFMSTWSRALSPQASTICVKHSTAYAVMLQNMACALKGLVAWDSRPVVIW